MFAKVHRPVNTPGVINNKGTCVKLAEYLQKENENVSDENKTSFFNSQYDSCASSTVINSIDNNIMKLTKRDDKFYMLSLNPSNYENKNLIFQATGKDVKSFDELTKDDKQKVFSEMREYTRKCMDSYAQNFNRENINSGADLVYYAKIETERHYHHFEKAVKDGEANTGDLKPGINLHVHIVVSRKDLTGKTKLSPLSKSRGNTWDFEGKQVTRGFNHVQWKDNCNTLFRENYNSSEKYSSFFQNRVSENKLNKELKSGVSKIENTIVNKVENKIKKETLQGHFSDERKIVTNVNKTINVITNPKQAIISNLKKQVRDIISGNDKTV